MKKAWGWTGVALIFTLCFSLLASADVIKLRLSDQFPPSHKNFLSLDQWCKEVEKRTNGQVKVTHYPANALVPITKTYDAVVTGTVDIGTTLIAYSPGRFPLSEFLSLPLGFKSGYQATKLANEYYKKFRPKEWEETKVLFFHASGPGVFQVKKDIKSLDEIKGLRIKANAENADIVRQLGGAPVTLPITETYEALQRGIIDGVLLPIEPIKGWRLGDHLRTVVLNHAVSYTTAMYVVMNKKVWESLPKEVQQVIEKLNEEWIEYQGKLWNELDQEAMVYIKEKGIKVVEATPEEYKKVEELMKPIIEKYIKDTTSKGLPGDQVVKFAQEFIRSTK